MTDKQVRPKEAMDYPPNPHLPHLHGTLSSLSVHWVCPFLLLMLCPASPWALGASSWIPAMAGAHGTTHALVCYCWVVGVPSPLWAQLPQFSRLQKMWTCVFPKRVSESETTSLLCVVHSPHQCHSNPSEMQTQSSCFLFSTPPISPLCNRDQTLHHGF